MSEKEKKNEEFIHKYVQKRKGLYNFCRFLAIVLTRIVYNPQYINTDKVPSEGGLVIASNHIHMPDPSFLMVSTKRIIRFLAKKELLDSWVGFLYRAANTIPVDRHGNAHNSLVAAEAALQMGEVIGVFPEGTRNRKMEEPLLPFKFGAVKMASQTGAAIIPVALISKGRPFIDRYKIVYGEPYYIGKDADLAQENEILRNKVLQLIEEYK